MPSPTVRKPYGVHRTTQSPLLASGQVLMSNLSASYAELSSMAERLQSLKFAIVLCGHTIMERRLMPGLLAANLGLAVASPKDNAFG